jgi:hypothetical protein
MIVIRFEKKRKDGTQRRKDAKKADKLNNPSIPLSFPLRLCVRFFWLIIHWNFNLNHYQNN